MSRGTWVPINFSVSLVRARGAELGCMLLCCIKLSMFHMRTSMLLRVAACNTVLCIAVELASCWTEQPLHMQVVCA